MRIFVLLVLLSVLTPVLVTEAKEGLYLGAEMAFIDVERQDASGRSIAPGDGAGVVGGYGLGRSFAIEASFWESDHDTSTGSPVAVRAALLGLKVSHQFRDSRIEPYLLLGAGRYRFDSMRGEGWGYGAGIDIRLTTAFTFTLGIERHVVDLGTDPRESIGLLSTTIGIAYFFP